MRAGFSLLVHPALCRGIYNPLPPSPAGSTQALRRDLGRAMPGHTPPSPQMPPAKRHRASSPDKDSPGSLHSATAGPSPATSDQHDVGLPGAGAGARQDVGGGSAKVGQSSSFRNVSACNRCRLRKNRCDQKLPSCASCEKANVACVGYDPITKKEIPRR